MDKQFKCNICGKKSFGYGHNAQPFTDKRGVCCDKCNYEVVIKTRLLAMASYMKGS